MLNILSLGAGVQSSTMALMAAEGELSPMPDCAIFADTGAGPDHVYQYLDYLEGIIPFPVHRVMQGEGLEKHTVEAAKTGSFTTIPFFIEGGGIGKRQCTSNFKIVPINRKVRDLMGLVPRQKGPKEVAVKMWIGISTDEAVRMKPSRIKWIENIWPLIGRAMSREACLDWMKMSGYELPRKSSCYFCPYRDNASWIEMRDNDEGSWLKAVMMDTLMQESYPDGPQYIHRSKVPLSDVEFDPNKDQHDMFDHECEGMCGV